MAPELLAHATEPTAAADMYSLGATAYECATGGLLPRFGGGGAAQGPNGGLPSLGCSAHLEALIAVLLHPEPTRRPTAEVRCSPASHDCEPVGPCHQYSHHPARPHFLLACRAHTMELNYQQGVWSKQHVSESKGRLQLTLNGLTW